MRAKDFFHSQFGALSLPVPDKKYFTQDLNNYHLDWYDTTKAQAEFEFQNNSFKKYLLKMKKKFRIFKPFIILFRGRIVKKLEKMSPYYEKNS